ncbi:hypothetical protein SAMN04489757_14231 [Anaerocolumna aminovalerica]|uniref:Uncharacterized protein n=1 Tax=Anaerocolumna aminovalerica TaxID=1527 RepID=A0A1I5IBQ9_9FIRM|nr:hypothetical protein SAMN04489757_14231 [Anaerocolumna aminovalerica]
MLYGVSKGNIGRLEFILSHLAIYKLRIGHIQLKHQEIMVVSGCILMHQYLGELKHIVKKFVRIMLTLVKLF